MGDFVTRFAPSPTGRLHLGHVFSAFQVRRAADQAGGKAFLRIEDTDLSRCRPEFEAAIYEDLDWLGLHWDGDVRRQSDNLDDYAAIVEDLRRRDLVYRCFLSRSKIAELTGGDPETPFTSQPLPPDDESQRLERGEAFAWRLSLARARDVLGSAYDDLTFTIETCDAERTVKAQP
ncbi:MAG: glutamate--tRNA ligase family protein, partial [Pseudomonadota bacterium]